jgi:tripartite ATP-independent transporter DctP family solute receptor
MPAQCTLPAGKLEHRTMENTPLAPGTASRRSLTRRTLLAALAAPGLAAPAIARAADAIVLRFSTAAPPADFLARGLESFKAAVAAADVGLRIETYPASTLFRQGTEVPALQRGTLEMSTMTTFEVAQQMPQFGFFNRGFLFRDYDHLSHVFNGPIGAEYAAAVAGGMGIRILATHYLGTRQVNLRKRRSVSGPADLAGVKLRMTAGPEWQLLGRALGANPVPLGMPEVYLALKTGTVDGQENPLAIMNAAKLYEVTEQVVLTAHMRQPVFFNIAGPVWDKLSPEQQRVLATAARSTTAAIDRQRLDNEEAITVALRGRGLAVDPVDPAPFRANADQVYAEASKAWDRDWLARVNATA